ncbi:MAG: hypothetical protein GY737_24610 [Desulfobacteraceae bacterium]|nr:hypothetical protein [Desulfobacteraceae bacterium]
MMGRLQDVDDDETDKPKKGFEVGGPMQTRKPSGTHRRPTAMMNKQQAAEEQKRREDQQKKDSELEEWETKRKEMLEDLEKMNKLIKQRKADESSRKEKSGSKTTTTISGRTRDNGLSI